MRPVGGVPLADKRQLAEDVPAQRRDALGQEDHRRARKQAPAQRGAPPRPSRYTGPPGGYQAEANDSSCRDRLGVQARARCNAAWVQRSDDMGPCRAGLQHYVRAAGLWARHAAPPRYVFAVNETPQPHPDVASGLAMTRNARPISSRL